MDNEVHYIQGTVEQTSELKSKSDGNVILGMLFVTWLVLMPAVTLIVYRWALH